MQRPMEYLERTETIFMLNLKITIVNKIPGFYIAENFPIFHQNTFLLN